VDIEIGIGANINTPTPCVAQIDTGANYVVVDEELVRGLTPMWHVDGNSASTAIAQAGVFLGALSFPDVELRVMCQVASLPLRGRKHAFPVIIGRSLLKDFRLVMDFSAGDFTLEYKGHTALPLGDVSPLVER
jgi:hypothetical protein